MYLVKHSLLYEDGEAKMDLLLDVYQSTLDLSICSDVITDPMIALIHRCVNLTTLKLSIAFFMLHVLPSMNQKISQRNRWLIFWFMEGRTCKFLIFITRKCSDLHLGIQWSLFSLHQSADLRYRRMFLRSELSCDQRCTKEKTPHLSREN